MSQCVAHKINLPDTQRHYRPATEIPTSVPIVSVDLELGFAAYATLFLSAILYFDYIYIHMY